MSQILLPKWLERIPPGAWRDIYTNRFYIRLAALYATEIGTVTALAELIGVDYGTLKQQALSVVRASDDTREGIRLILGDAFVPPEMPVLPRLRALEKKQAIR